MEKLYEPLDFFREFRSLRGEHESLVVYIEKYTSIIFSEEITWVKNKASTADLEGKDADGNPVIVAAEIWAPHSSERKSQEDSAIEQRIRHADVYSTKYPADSIRLFIAGFGKAPNIERACESSHADGVNIRYIDVSDIVDSANQEITAIQDMLYAL